MCTPCLGMYTQYADLHAQVCLFLHFADVFIQHADYQVRANKVEACDALARTQMHERANQTVVLWKSTGGTNFEKFLR